MSLGVSKTCTWGFQMWVRPYWRSKTFWTSCWILGKVPEGILYHTRCLHVGNKSSQTDSFSSLHFFLFGSWITVDYEAFWVSSSDIKLILAFLFSEQCDPDCCIKVRLAEYKYSSAWGLEAAAISVAVLPTARKSKSDVIRKTPSVSSCGGTRLCEGAVKLWSSLPSATAVHLTGF